MNIIEKTYSWKGSLSKRKSTKRIILHHAESSSCTADDIHRWHLARGWSGIGYHFFVRKDGSIYRGRPEDVVGAHASGANSDSIGICAEGKYMTETMPDVQKQAIAELCSYLMNKYGVSTILRHKDVTSTDCPGNNYPFDEIVAAAKGTSVPNVTSQPAQPSQPTSSKPSGYDKWIARLQAECNAQGFSNQTVDGINGPNTLAGCPTVKKGAKGNITKLIQERLNSVGFSLDCDGIFGDKTHNAVKVFQKNRSLTRDGIVGKNTWSWLLKGTKM